MIVEEEKKTQVIMLLWFGGVEAKPDKNRFNDGTLFSAEVINSDQQMLKIK